MEESQPLPQLSDMDVSRLLFGSVQLDYHPANIAMPTGRTMMTAHEELLPELSFGAAFQQPARDGGVPTPIMPPAYQPPAQLSSAPKSPQSATPQPSPQQLEASLGRCLSALAPADAGVHISGYLNGYRHPVRVFLAPQTSIAEFRCTLLETQARTHPHRIPEEHYGRVMLLTSQPTTMNTSCKFSEDSVIHDVNVQGEPLTVGDLEGDAVYIYLLCPERPLASEHTSHRRLAKRDAGVCEAHRGHHARSKRKTHGLTSQAFALPSMRARVTRENGEKLSMNDVDRVKAMWQAKLPDLMKGFLQEHGLQVDDVKWTGSRKGSVILDFDIIVSLSSGKPVPAAARAAFMERFEEYLAELEPELMAAAVEPLEVSHFGFIDTFEDYHDEAATAATAITAAAEEPAKRGPGAAIHARQERCGLSDHLLPLTVDGCEQFLQSFLGLERAYSCMFHNQLLRMSGADEKLFITPADIVLDLQRDATAEPNLSDLSLTQGCMLCAGPANCVAYSYRASEDTFAATSLPTAVDSDGRHFTLSPFRYPGREETSVPLDFSDPRFAGCYNPYWDMAMNTFPRIHNDLVRTRGLDRHYEISRESLQFYAEYGDYDDLPAHYGMDLSAPADSEAVAQLLKNLEADEVMRVVLIFSPEAVLRTASDSLLT